ncbi:hypothetical protein LEP1GSC195_0295 [Leptospira wolbachii serovar Codice str. CDC]|uniref:Uncharacterized protein n=1 Tax=Leptospira wolbachii serovar Codice str. CDC TaxID=1218599 RepID=R9ABQ4_9LEPT|nr:hypothetical protein LEP1GSC195_0295 [Leptospira wolbachii serovar Codice str. CDC]
MSYTNVGKSSERKFGAFFIFTQLKFQNWFLFTKSEDILLFCLR